VIPLQIRNNGEIVEGYSIEVVGPSAAWTTVEPDTVSLYPGSATTATLAFHPPRSAAVLAGEVPFGVRVVPTEHPEDAVVPEGVLEILPFLETSAELTPRTSRGRRGGRHQIAIDNRGNVPVTAVLTASDPAQQLMTSLRPEVITVAPGHADFATLRVRPVRTIWRGQAVTHQFQVQVTPKDAPAVTLDGTHLQEQVIPAWLPKALLALLALLAALAALWFAVFKPTIQAAAKDAVKPQVQAAQKQADQAKTAAQQAGAAAQDASGSKEVADKSAQVAAANVGIPPTPTDPISQRLAVQTDPGSTARDTYTVPAKRTFELTDVVMQNPQGDFGIVTLQRGTQALFTMALENFRDNDYHFVSPIRVGPGEKLELVVRCNGVGAPPDQTPAPTKCSTSAYLGGGLTRPPASTPSPSPAATPRP
jgi:hypothetical protein